jgi:hypothetical protein
VYTRLYFDLKAVADQARHAILADGNCRTRQQRRDNVTPGPALWFYRHAGRVQLSSNGTRSGFELAGSEALTVYAQPHDALTTPAARPPYVDDCAVLPLLEPDGRSLFDLLCDGLAANRQWAMLDPQTLALGVGRRRHRTRTAPPRVQAAGPDSRRAASTP